MNKKEIEQAQELIDSVRNGGPLTPIEAVFPESAPEPPNQLPRLDWATTRGTNTATYLVNPDSVSGGEAGTPQNEPTVAESLKYIRKIEGCTSDTTKLLVLKSFAKRVMAGTPSTEARAQALEKLLNEVAIVTNCGSVEDWTVEGIRKRLREAMYWYGQSREAGVGKQGGKENG